jgi:hypothetical protein
MHTVHVRVNDAATGRPTPVRIRFSTADGRYLAPFGRLAEFATATNVDVGGNVRLGDASFAYIDGTCEIALPAGTVNVAIHKGPEYLPVEREISLAAGKMALRFNIERWTDRRRDGWYPGDTRAHFLSPHAAWLEGMAEDLAVVNLLAEEREVGCDNLAAPAIPNLLAFSGQVPALANPGALVVVNTHNVHPVLGSLGLLNCHRPVYPLRFGGAGGKDDWTLADWCDQCHRKGGLAVWTQGADRQNWGEVLADLLLGKVDAFEVAASAGSRRDRLSDWYTLLNAGLQVPLVGASAKTSNTAALGAIRTYARLQAGEPLTYGSWIEAVRGGRTFITSGPLVTFTVAGHDPGAALSVGATSIPVRAEASSLAPFEVLEIIANGETLAAARASRAPARAMWQGDLELPMSTWLAARCRGCDDETLAHTSPAYVTREGAPFVRREQALAALARQLDRLQSWVEKDGRFDTEQQRHQLLEIVQEARLRLAAPLTRRPVPGN